MGQRWTLPPLLGVVTSHLLNQEASSFHVGAPRRAPKKFQHQKGLQRFQYRWPLLSRTEHPLKFAPKVRMGPHVEFFAGYCTVLFHGPLCGFRVSLGSCVKCVQPQESLRPTGSGIAGRWGGATGSCRVVRLKLQ